MDLSKIILNEEFSPELSWLICYLSTKKYIFFNRSILKLELKGKWGSDKITKVVKEGIQKNVFLKCRRGIVSSLQLNLKGAQDVSR